MKFIGDDESFSDYDEEEKEEVTIENEKEGFFSRLRNFTTGKILTESDLKPVLEEFET